MHGKIKSTEIIGRSDFSLRRWRQTIVGNNGFRYEKSVPRLVKPQIVEVLERNKSIDLDLLR